MIPVGRYAGRNHSTAQMHVYTVSHSDRGSRVDISAATAGAVVVGSVVGSVVVSVDGRSIRELGYST